MSPWIIVLIIAGGVLAVFVVPGLIMRLRGGSFWWGVLWGVLLMAGHVAGANAFERAFHIEPRCPWTGCNYDLQPHRWRHPSSCPACRQPIRWMREGRVPVRVEPEEAKR